jgi:23S rRNA U2552 (ribose-2'-O)-methylase RlmE/FtsJ
MYNPQFIVYKLLSENTILNKYLEHENNVILNVSMNLPLISLGYHAFIKNTKSSLLTVVNKLQTQNDLYYIVNPFEYNITDYNESLKFSSFLYFNNKYEYKKEFYILWEIMFIFNIFYENKKDEYLIISDIPCEYMYSIINYHSKINELNVKYKINIINITNNGDNDEICTDNLEIPKKSINIINSSCKKFYKSKINKNNLIILDINVKIDEYIIVDQEPKFYEILINTIYIIFNYLEKDGIAIIKIYDTFTLPTLKLIYLLTSMFNENYVYKPLLSRPTDSDKYLILKSFKTDDLDKKIKIIENIQKEINGNNYIFDIFPKLILPEEFINKFKFINIKLVNTQQIMMHNIIKYIKENNYFGEKYHMYREKQIEVNKWWIYTFYPPSNNLVIKNKDEINKLLNNNLEKNIIEMNNYFTISNI